LPVTAWEWSADPPALGQITPEGHFVAGEEVSTGHVVAECDWEGQHYIGNALVHIGIMPEVYVVVQPEEITLPPGAMQAFEAHAYNQWGIEIPVPFWEWTVVPPALGWISPMGIFHAGNAPASGQVQARCQIGGAWHQGEAFVQVGGPPIFHAEVIPPEAIMPPNGEFQFLAILFNPQGQPVPGLEWIWWVEPPNLGIVDSMGLFQAGQQPGDGFVHTRTEFEGEWYESHAHVLVGQGPPPGGIIGCVMGATPGGPVPLLNAHVIAFPENPFFPPHETFTNPQGFYELHDLPPGVYLVKAQAPDFISLFWPNAPNPEMATPIPVLGWTVAGINFLLPLGSQITGVVVNEATGEPLAEVMLVANRLGSALERWTFSNPEGSYVITGLIPGDYVVHSQKPGFAPEFFENAPSFAEATIIEVAPPDILDQINFSLIPQPAQGGAIVGTVTDETSGAAIGGAWVLALPVEGGPPHLTPTNPQGDYIIGNLPPGIYLMQCWAFGYLGEFYENATTWLEADPVEVSSGEETPIQFELATATGPGAYLISGAVLDDEGEPIGNANVYLMNSEGNALYHGTTQDDGNYSISCAAGSYYVKADAALHEVEYYNAAASLGEAETVTVGSGLDLAGIDFQLGLQAYTAVEDEGQRFWQITQYHLQEAIPNPFNPATTIRYDLPVSGVVHLSVYNIRGQEVATLVQDWRAAGSHEVVFDGSNLSSGLYICKISANDFTSSMKLILLK
ncbi:MAG: carboxypeptidase regulatory-like domain-containing protein, partial [bacterium]